MIALTMLRRRFWQGDGPCRAMFCQGIILHAKAFFAVGAARRGVPRLSLAVLNGNAPVQGPHSTLGCATRMF